MIHDSSLWQSLFSPVRGQDQRLSLEPAPQQPCLCNMVNAGTVFGRSSYKLTLQKCGDLLLNIVFLDLGVSGGKGGPF